MRPVLLEMDGFAAFREATTVDFRGVEYFVLVGPTGSGKSTVIDAMTFALYGTVPRWDDRKSVQSALAPTVNRGTVRLVFDVGPHRYVAARELRRAAKGNVGVKNARLERLADPTGTGAAGEDTEVLAADREVSRAVEALLGLSFEHFCTCVVLPQGDFAQFMHASPADRQKILTRLLGIGVYETIAKEAGIRATGQQQRADLLAEQLTGYTDATPEAAAAADLRVAELAALAERLGSHLADLAAAQTQLDDAFQVVSRLSEERELLAGVAVPPGIADLDGRRRQARQAADRSREQLTEAETADHATRDRRAAAPARGPLEQARRDHAELANTLAAESDARQRHEQSVADLDAASREAAAARADLDAAREAHATAGDNVTATRDTVTRLTAEHRLLTGLRAPDGLDALAERLAAAGHDRARAQAEMAAAESADTAVRAALSAAPPRGPLEQAHRDHAELAAALTELPAHEERLATTRTRLAAADATVTQAEGRLEHARAALDAAVRADLAGTLRLHLVAGAPCPVCDQDVAAPPAALQAAGLGAAETAVAASEGELARARDSALLAAGANHEAAAAADAARTHVARLREALAGAPPTAAAVDQQLATLDRLAAAATAADARLRAAHRSMDTAAAAGEAAAVEAAAAARALSAARDPLVHLGAPPLDGDPRTGWATLTAWARDLAAEHAQQLAAATGRAASASLAADAAHQSLKAATERAEHTQQAETATARAEQRARTDLDHLLTRARQLREALAAAPTDEQATAELARIDLLDTAALAADQARRAAQAAREAADHAAAQADREADTARTALQAARDPLVRLGAPVTTADNLLDAWTALATWADGQRAGRDAALPAAHDAAAGLKTALGHRPPPPRSNAPAANRPASPNVASRPRHSTGTGPPPRRTPTSRASSPACSARTSSPDGWSPPPWTHSSRTPR